MMEDKFVDLGFCRRVHGIKGEFQFKLDNPEDSLITKKSIIHLAPLDGSELVEGDYEVESIRFGNKVICKLKDVSDRNLAESYLPFKIQLSRDAFPELSDDEFYLNDLIGCRVIDSRTDQEIGVIEKFYFSGAQDIAIIKKNSGSLELPLIEKFFLDVDIEENQVVVFVPEYIE